jgi:hypothetical protein
MIEILFDPFAYRLLQMIEVMHHSLVIERFGLKRNGHPGGVPVQVSTLPLIPEKTVTVTERK